MVLATKWLDQTKNFMFNTGRSRRRYNLKAPCARHICAYISKGRDSGSVNILIEA